MKRILFYKTPHRRFFREPAYRGRRGLTASGMESLEPQLRCNLDSTSRDSRLLKASVVFRTFTLRDPMRRKPAASFTENKRQLKPRNRSKVSSDTWSWLTRLRRFDGDFVNQVIGVIR